MTDADRASVSRKSCREIMTKDVKTARPQDSVRDVAAMMLDGDMGAVPVVEGEKLIGMVTDRDIVIRVVARGGAPSTPVSEAMTTELFTVKPEDFAFEAIRLMGDKQVRRIPVVDADVYQTPDGWVVKVELAGVSVDDMVIDIQDNVLCIAGSRKDRSCTVGATYQQMEITYSNFEKKLRFPATIDGATIEHEFENGLLIIQLRKGGA